ncbi:BrnT family toxin [Paraburkholderia elongata]|uniref:BrnT family toxin n=1 Tax=Paraburkholderia elongata TaxID=2675747 RepID=A0A972ST36_9BURK|nr:BrnT family toxin [Paraburkholderia elongata]NPT62535.1 BrnT family toxin [Paraburkholderia elongata]
MQIEFDPVKDQINQGKHGVSLAMAEAFEMDVALVWRDNRFDYSEERFTAFGPIGDRIYSLSFTMRGETLRAISLRKANRREVLKYVDEA